MAETARSESADGELPFRQSIDGVLESTIGEHGLTAAELHGWLERLQPAIDQLRHTWHSRTFPLLSVCEETDDIVAAEQALATLTEGARTLVFFGTGGASLGGQALAQLGGWDIPGSAPEDQKQKPRTRFYDNLDAHTLARVLATLDLASTRLVVTSKSGNTPETLVQALAAIDAVKQSGLAAQLPRLLLGITEPSGPDRRNGLRDVFEAHGIPLLEHNSSIGGRYSVLTTVGLVPALARGLDVRALRTGARDVISTLLSASTPRQIPPALGAAVNVALAKERGVDVSVLIPYSDRLGRFAHWYVQLWSESLGKSGEGTTPIACVGPVFQHSQLQLFMDGPRRHLLTVLRPATTGVGPRIDPDLAEMAGIGEMAGRTAGDLIAAEAQGVVDALADVGRPVRLIEMNRLDERTLGALLMHFMLETILASQLLGVDPFDQPAVELGKALSRKRLLG